MDLIQEEEQPLTRRTLPGLAQIPGHTVYGIKDPDSTRFAQKDGVTVLGLRGIVASQVAKELAERGAIGMRSGCHCAHLLIKHRLQINPMLERMQALMLTLFPKIELPGLARVSLDVENSEEDVGRLFHALVEIIRQSQTGVDQRVASADSRTPMVSKTNVQRQLEDVTWAASQRVNAQPEKQIRLAMHGLAATAKSPRYGITRGTCSPPPQS